MEKYLPLDIHLDAKSAAFDTRVYDNISHKNLESATETVFQIIEESSTNWLSFFFNDT